MKKYALILSMLSLVACSDDKPQKSVEVPKAVKTIKLVTEKLESKYSFPGKVFPGEQANVTFKVSGKITNLPIKDGQEVKKGQIIAQLDQKDFKFTYEKQLASYNEYKSSFERAKELIKNKYISQADFDTKRKAFKVAAADLNIAKTNLGYATLKAPFSGVIANVYPKNHQNIQAQENVANLQNLENIDIKIFLPENKIIKKVNEDDLRIEVFFEDLAKKAYPASIKEVSTQADYLTQTYEVTMTLPRPNDINVLPGMTATVNTYLKSKDISESGYIIPADALFPDVDKSSYVWVVNKKMRLEKRKVTALNFEAENANITSGLYKGDIIVITGVSFLRENQLVRIYNK